MELNQFVIAQSLARNRMQFDGAALEAALLLSAQRRAALVCGIGRVRAACQQTITAARMLTRLAAGRVMG